MQTDTTATDLRSTILSTGRLHLSRETRQATSAPLVQSMIEHDSGRASLAAAVGIRPVLQGVTISVLSGETEVRLSNGGTVNSSGVPDTISTSAPLGAATFNALRRSVGTRARRFLLAVTLLLGLLAAAGLALAGPPGDRTLAKLSDFAQSLMSVIVPAFGILLARDVKRAAGTARLTPTLLAAALLAAVVAVFGFLVCVAALTVTTSGAQNPWRHVGTIAVGSVLVQVVAQLVGTGLGLLMQRPAIAFVASIVLPLGLWFLLGAIDALRPAQALTPYSSVRHLLSGQMSAVNWAQWLGVLLIWGVGLNALGAARLRQRNRA